VIGWLRTAAAHFPGWLVPALVVVVTGWLGEVYDEQVVAYWLGVVTACVAYALTKVAVEPADYARHVAIPIGIAAGLGLTQVLLHHLGSSLL
jgi:hypothetical protein